MNFPSELPKIRFLRFSFDIWKTISLIKYIVIYKLFNKYIYNIYRYFLCYFKFGFVDYYLINIPIVEIRATVELIMVVTLNSATRLLSFLFAFKIALFSVSIKSRSNKIISVLFSQFKI